VRFCAFGLLELRYWSYWVDDVRAARGGHEDGTPRLRGVISVPHSNVTRGKLLQYPILDN
jgi:hypothetical protein